MKEVYYVKKLKFFLLNPWAIPSYLIIALILLPNLSILSGLLYPPNENWYHIKIYLLQDYVVNTTILITMTGLLTVIIGTSLAYLVTFYIFPLRNFWRLALILPLSIPPYMAAYTYSNFVSYTGPIQVLLRSLEMKVNQKYFDIMSIEGAIFIYTMFLYPYVYLMTRAFFEKQSASLLESARLLGRKPLAIFLQILLPLARPAYVAGASLVILEVLNDYGVVQYFGIPAFSNAIFSAWFSLGDIQTAIRLAALLMILAFAVLALEKGLRGRQRFSATTAKVRPVLPWRLQGVKSWLAFLFCFLIFALAFLLPLLQLVYWALLTYKSVLNSQFIEPLVNSIMLATVSALLIIILAVIVGNFSRLSRQGAGKIAARLTIIGYSIPGAVIAIGVITFFVWLDRQLYWFYQIFSNSNKTLFLSTSIVMLLFAYVIRFLAIGYNAVEAGFAKISVKYFEAARTLGSKPSRAFFQVDLPLVKPALLSGFILVFVDILKELPLTLILQPFNFHTLATRAYRYASNEMVQEAAIASLIIIAVSSVSIVFFYHLAERRNSSHVHRNQ